MPYCYSRNTRCDLIITVVWPKSGHDTSLRFTKPANMSDESGQTLQGMGFCHILQIGLGFVSFEDKYK